MSLQNEEIESIIAKAEKDDVWKSYLFEKLGKIENPSKWLNILTQKGYFDPKNNPAPQAKGEKYIVTEYWDALGFLTRVSEINKSHPNDEITKRLQRILVSIISYRDENGKRIENTRSDWLLIKMIFDLPITEITDDQIQFVKIALDQVKTDTILISNEITERIIPYLIEKKAKKLILSLLDIVLDFEISNKSYLHEVTSIIGDFYLSELVKKYQKDLLEICGIELYDLLLKKANKVISLNKRIFSSIITIEESSQNMLDTYKFILIGFLRDALTNQQPKDIKKKIEGLLREENPVLKRIAISAINSYYSDLNGIFWEMEPNPLNELMLKHELYELFKNHSAEFDDAQIQRILKWVESEDFSALVKYYEGKDKAELERAIAHYKKEWLTSLLDSGDKKVRELYDKYSEIAPEEIAHPGYNVWTSGVSVGLPRSEKLEEKLEGKKNEEIVEYLRNYKREPEKWEDVISVADSLAIGFKDYVTKNSVQISETIEPFLSLPVKFQVSLLSGLIKALENKEKINWHNILNFCLELLGKEDFWQTISQEKEELVKEIARLIITSTRDKSTAIDQENLPIVEKILITMASNDPSQRPEIADLFTSVLNSTKGNIYSAMILYSLRYAELKSEKVWKKEIKEYFENKIDETTAPIEFYVTMGQYLPYISHLDNNWVSANINKVFPKDQEERWKATTTGYFYSSNTLYLDLYRLLRESNNYSKMLGTDFEDKFVSTRAVDHVCIAYLNGLENIDEQESLIRKIIDTANIKKISEVVNFVWRIKIKLSAEQKEKIIVLWEKLVERLLPKEYEPEISKVLSSLSNWINVIDDLNQRCVKLLKISARHIGADFNLFLLIDNLTKFVDTKPREVGEIFNEAITKETLLFHKVEQVQKIVTILFEKEATDIANEICEKFWENKQFFLKEICDKYNKTA